METEKNLRAGLDPREARRLTLVISILACAVPIRRALRLEPTEALRAGI